jgi:hypothetical protein
MGRRSRVAGLLVLVHGAVFGALLPRVAAADSLTGTRSDELHERSHTIELRLEPGHAEMTVRRTLENKGPRTDQAIYFLDLPLGAVATGLRSMGYADGRHLWFTGELLEREEAARRYKELTGLGTAFPKDPAHLYWVGYERLGLQVFPIMPGALKTVEYTLKLPTEWIDGQDVVTIPSRAYLTSDLPDVVVTSKNPEDALFTDLLQQIQGCSGCDSNAIRRPVKQGARLSLLGGGDVRFALERKDTPRLGGRAATIPLKAGRAFTHFRVEAARRVGHVPRGARVVILLDQSHSMAGAFDAELAAARATLAHFVDAEVEIVPFDRKPRPRFGKLTAGAIAHADLGRMQLAAANGSNLDLALASADGILAATPAGTPRRVLLFTDLRTRDALTPDSVRGKLAASGALLHVVRVADGTPSVERDDEGDWARIPRSTGGLLWNGHASRSTPDGGREVFEELARPKRIDRLRFVARGWPAGALEDPPETLDEGTAWDVHGAAAPPLGSLDIAGEIWSTPVRHTLAPDPNEAKHWAALFFGLGGALDVDDDDQMALARLGGAVSPVTSYLAIEPGVRPSTDGLEEVGAGGVGFGSGGGGVGSGIGLGHVGRLRVDRDAWLRDALAQARKACGAPALRVTVETTLDEIVDVRASSSDAAARCVVEAAWAFTLPAAFDEEHATFAVDLT